MKTASRNFSDLRVCDQFATKAQVVPEIQKVRLVECALTYEKGGRA